MNHIKGRKSPISIVINDFEQLVSFKNLSKNNKIFVLNNISNKTTFILPNNNPFVHKSIMGDNHSIGFRIPKNKFSPNLVSYLGYPITSSSVNRHGKRPMNNPKKIIDEFGDEVDIIINAGVLPNSGGSKIYLLKNNKFEIVRN